MSQIFGTRMVSPLISVPGPEIVGGWNQFFCSILRFLSFPPCWNRPIRGFDRRSSPFSPPVSDRKRPKTELFSSFLPHFWFQYRFFPTLRLKSVFQYLLLPWKCMCLYCNVLYWISSGLSITPPQNTILTTHWFSAIVNSHSAERHLRLCYSW